MNIEKKFYHVAVFDSLGKIAQQKRDLTSNAAQVFDLRTPFEKQNALNQLEGQKAQLQPKVVSALATDWATVKQEYQDLKRAKIGAADRASKQWDYARLDYERKSARDFLGRAELAKIEKRYGEIELTGDTHALRAFVEEGIESLGDSKKFSGPDSSRALDLRQEFEKMRGEVTVTKEMRDLAKQGEILTGKIADLYDATRKASSEFAKAFEPSKDGNGDYMAGEGQPNPFAAMTQGVQVTRRIEPTTTATITEVDLRGEGWNGDAPSQQWKAVEKNGQYFRTPA